LPQLRIRLCDNHYPFGLDALRALQAAQQSSSTPVHQRTGQKVAAGEAGPSCSHHVHVPKQACSSVLASGGPRPAVVIEMVRHDQHDRSQQEQRPSSEIPLRGDSFGRKLLMQGGATAGHHRRTTSHITDSSDPDTGCGVCMVSRYRV
jgi:hypothetical protein